jgi:hypothetical protein
VVALVLLLQVDVLRDGLFGQRREVVEQEGAEFGLRRGQQAELVGGFGGGREGIDYGG